MRFIFMAMLLIGCGTADPQPRTIEIEKKVEVSKPFYIDTSKVDIKLLPHVMEFAGYCEKFGTSTKCKENFNKIKSIKIVKSFPEKFVVGKCFTSLKERWVEILDWQEIDSLTTKTVATHELAHCALGDPFPHYDEEDDIMNSVLISDKSIFYNWPKLIKAMFLRAGGSLPLTQEKNTPTITQSTITETGEVTCETREDSVSRH